MATKRKCGWGEGEAERQLKPEVALLRLETSASFIVNKETLQPGTAATVSDDESDFLW